jgi:hypothetical protein
MGQNQTLYIKREGHMRKFLLATLAAPAMAAATLLLPAAAAQATTSTTIHATNTFNTGATGCPLLGDLIITGSAVLHQTFNNAGEPLGTFGMITGAAVTNGTTVATGHATALLGDKANNQNFVEHFTVNAQLTLPDGSTVSVHQQGQFTFNANGTIVVNNTTTTCG